MLQCGSQPRVCQAKFNRRIIDYTQRIAKALKIIGPFNVQYIVKAGDVLVIECNLRASRSMPFVSKMNGVNLLDAGAEAVLGNSIENYLNLRPPTFKVGVKMPQFSFMQLEGADPLLGVEMQSTGEVACFGENFFDAYCKALASSGYKIPMEGNVLISVGGTESQEENSELGTETMPRWATRFLRRSTQQSFFKARTGRC